MTRVVHKQATKVVRARHQRGVEYLQALFGWTPTEAAERSRAKRDDQATGPTYEGAAVISRKRRGKDRAGQHPTRHHWSRKGRRQVAKAQRVARRSNRP